MRDHDVVVEALTAFAPVLFGAMCPEVHCRRIVPEEEGLAFLVGLVDEAESTFGYLIVDRLHAFLCQGAGILNRLSAFAVGPAVEHASGPKPLPEFRVLRIVN